jgi:hypothetical protein
MRALKRGEVTLLQKGYLYNNTHPTKRSCVVKREWVPRDKREQARSALHPRFTPRGCSAQKQSPNYL